MILILKSDKDKIKHKNQRPIETLNIGIQILAKTLANII